MFSSVALAQATPTAPVAQPSMLENMFPLLMVVVVMYFLVLRPHAKQKREQQKLITALKRGDKVLTSGGILGTIEGLTDHVVTLEISQGVSIKIMKSQISGLAKEIKA